MIPQSPGALRRGPDTLPRRTAWIFSAGLLCRSSLLLFSAALLCCSWLFLSSEAPSELQYALALFDLWQVNRNAVALGHGTSRAARGSPLPLQRRQALLRARAGYLPPARYPEVYRLRATPHRHSFRWTYKRARYYDPAVGRFVSEDPIGFAGGDANVVRYVANEPTSANDPSGLAKSKWPRGIGKIIVNRDTAEIVLDNGKRIKIRNSQFIDSCVSLRDLESLTEVAKDKIARLRRRYGDDLTITYNKAGQPDFSPYMKASVKIKNIRASNYAELAWKKLKEDNPRLYARLWPARYNYNWHHAQDGSLQLVDKDLHSAFQHTGLNSILRQLPAMGIAALPGGAALTEGRYNDACREAVWSFTPLTWISDLVAGMFGGLYDMAVEDLERSREKKVKF